MQPHARTLQAAWATALPAVAVAACAADLA